MFPAVTLALSLLAPPLSPWMTYDEYPQLPPLADVARFPSPEECTTQQSRMREHMAWLARMKRAWPERRVEFACWQAECERYLFLWEVLREAVQYWGYEDEEARRQRLDRWRYWIGEEAYRAGWTPPILPAGLHPKVAEIVPVMPPAG